MANHLMLDRVFAALADPTRRRILERLSRGSLTVGQIAQGFPLSQPAISKHVRVLEDCGLLHRDVVGRTHHCALSPGAMASASKWLDQQRMYWNASIDRLEILLSKSPKRK